MQTMIMEKEQHLEQMNNKRKHMKGLLYTLVDGKYHQYLEKQSIKLWKEFVHTLKQ
jgi:hypothetical protein